MRQAVSIGYRSGASISRHGSVRETESTETTLHDNTASAALLRCVRIFALGNDTPHGGHHVVARAVAVGDDAKMKLVC